MLEYKFIIDEKRAVCLDDGTGLCKEMIESSIQRDEEGNIVATSIEDPSKKVILHCDQAVSMNMFAFTKDIIQDLVRLFPDFLEENKHNPLTCEYLIPSVVTKLFKEKKSTLKLLPTSSVWYGVTYKDDKPEVVKSLKKLAEKISPQCGSFIYLSTSSGFRFNQSTRVRLGLKGLL